MAYLHCHTKSCGWSQDDFYSLNYNPISKIWSDIKGLWKPKIVKIDCRTFKDLTMYTHIPIIKFSYIRPDFNIEVFSWNLLVLEIVKDIRLGFEQKWWICKSFKKSLDNGKAKCPKCGENNFDID